MTVNYRTLLLMLVATTCIMVGAYLATQGEWLGALALSAYGGPALLYGCYADAINLNEGS